MVKADPIVEQIKKDKANKEAYGYGYDYDIKYVPGGFNEEDKYVLLVEPHIPWRGQGYPHLSKEVEWNQARADYVVSDSSHNISEVPDKYRTLENCRKVFIDDGDFNYYTGHWEYIPERHRSKIANEYAEKYGGRSLGVIPKDLHTSKIVEIAVFGKDGSLYSLGDTRDDLITANVLDRALKKEPFVLEYAPEKLKTKERVEKVVAMKKAGVVLIGDIPEKLLTKEIVTTLFNHEASGSADSIRFDEHYDMIKKLPIKFMNERVHNDIFMILKNSHFNKKGIIDVSKFPNLQTLKAVDLIKEFAEKNDVVIKGQYTNDVVLGLLVRVKEKFPELAPLSKESKDAILLQCDPEDLAGRLERIEKLLLMNLSKNKTPSTKVAETMPAEQTVETSPEKSTTG